MIQISVRRNKIFKVILLSFFIMVLINLFIICSASSYVPYPPSGVTDGTENIEYEFKVNTIEVGSFWMFDWDDGSYSDWIEVGGINSYISAKHIWSESGEYEVKVRHRSSYLVESPWSDPLIVTISEQTDNDGDGWKNDIEESYGKNPEDSEDYPLDTDNDGTPDEDSLDGKYKGDTDDDNDGLSDVIEIKLESDSKNSDDVVSFIFKDNAYYIVKTSGNRYILYNAFNQKTTKARYENSLYYVDFNGDGFYDYSYDGVLKEYFDIPWLYIILGLVISVIFILFLLFKKGVLFLYEEEIVVEK